MATQPVFDKPISVEEYLSTVYEHDCEYVDGVIEERDLGEFEHAFLQAILIGIFLKNREEWRILRFPNSAFRHNAIISEYPMSRSCVWARPGSKLSPTHRCW